MTDVGFDETYNVREAIDFLTDKLALREKLLQSAKQLSEKDGGQRFNVSVKRFEDLMADFLKLYQPVLDKIAGRKDTIQKEIVSQKQVLTGVTGMIEVAKGVEVLSDRVRELEGEVKTIEATIKDKSKSLEKIDYLLGKAKYRSFEAPRTEYEEQSSDTQDQPDEFLFGVEDAGRKSAASRKTAARG